MAYNYKPYEESDAVKNARSQLELTQASKPGEYQSQWTNQLNSTMQQILDRKDFKYDLNGDALYNQYKDQYTRQGKMAMQNTMAQAAALTGGYGNSYAQTAGQQQFQGYMQQLNDRIPELYQLAMSAYQQQGQNLQNKYNMLGEREGQDYGRYQDTVANWRNDLSYATGRYDTERSTDRATYESDRSYDWNTYQNAQQLALKQAEYYMSTGRSVPPELLAAAGLSQGYADVRSGDVWAAAQAAAEAQSGGYGGGDDKDLTAVERDSAPKSIMYEAVKVAGASGTQAAYNYINSQNVPTTVKEAAKEAVRANKK